MRTHLTELLGITTPIIQAPMAGGGDTAELVAAVSNAGALGSIGAAYLSPDQIIERGREVRSRTSRPFGINLFAAVPPASADEAMVQRAIERIAPYFRELGLRAPEPPKAPTSRLEDQVAACFETGAAVFSFTFGAFPNSVIQDAKRRGMLVMGTGTTVNEAKTLVQAGVDAIVAQGSEAGGHRGSFAGFEAGMVGTIALVPQIADAVRVPVVASGGIMDGRGIAAALALGASAVQMGTAFLTCAEAGVASAYKEAILSATEDQTRITRAFSGRPARGIVNRVLSEYESHEDAILPFPLQNALTRPLRAEATKQDRVEYLSLWAGQGARMARRTSAAELVRRLDAELAQAIEALAAVKCA